MDEVYLFLNLGFIVLGYRGLRAVYGVGLGGFLALLYALLTDPEVMLGLFLVTGGVVWLAIVLMGVLLGLIFTTIGVALRRIITRVT